MRLFLACVGLALGSFSLAAYSAAEIDDSFVDQLNAADDGTLFSGFIHFHGGTASERGEIVESAGLTAGYDYGSFTAARFAVGESAGFLALAKHPAVRYVEHDAPLEFFGETAVWASRARVAQEAVAGGPYYDADGNVLDGSGIGIAIIDSGVDGTHPDFEGRVSHSFKFFCTTPGVVSTATDQCFGEAVAGDPATLPFVDLGPGANSDIVGGHGTHVAGIAAGSGAASTGDYRVPGAAPNIAGTYTGVAPGASIVAYSIGEGLTVGSAVNAYTHLIENYDDITPRVRVTNNSYGTGGGRENPNGMLAAAFRELTARGVVIAFAAGNDSGDGSTIQTSPTCNSSTPGVICVASQDDQNTGDSDAGLSGFSSRGLINDPSTHPDIAATGSNYTSSCTQVLQPSQAVCSTGAETTWQPRYGTISGTSMATPHVAGAVALILQAQPDLTPAQVENLLQDTARKTGFPTNYIDDPQNPGNTTHFGWGAGMLDVQAALDALGVANAGDAASGDAGVALTSPMEGDAVSLDNPVTISGTVNDGQGAGGLPDPVHVVGGDLDSEIPGAADVTDVHIAVTETGISVEMLVRDATDLGPFGAAPLRLTQVVEGFTAVTEVIIDSAGASASTGTVVTAAAKNVALNGNTVTFDISFEELDDPSNGSVVHGLVVYGYNGLIVDAAPSTMPNAAAATFNTQPMFGKPYTIVRQDGVLPPSVQVQVSINGGTAQAAEVTGSSPNYTWSLPSAAGLVAGANTAVATLLLDGETAGADVVMFTGSGGGNGGPAPAVTDIEAVLAHTVLADGLTVEFDATASHVCYAEPCVPDTSGMTYTFFFGDDTSANGETGVADADGIITHTYGAAGTFEAFVVARHASGNSDFDANDVTTQLTVTADPQAARNAARLTADYDRSNPTIPLEVVFDASQTTTADGFEIAGYVFDFGDGNTVDTTSAVVQHTYTAAGTFAPQVTVTFESSDGSQADQTSVAKSSSVVAASPGNSAPVAAGGGSGGLGWLLLAPLALAGLRRRKA